MAHERALGRGREQRANHPGIALIGGTGPFHEAKGRHVDAER
jgi:hypothetical protein